MPITTAITSQFVNETRVLESSLTDASDFGGTTILVSGWAQLAVCVLIVVLCCCCTLLCLCTSCICCSNTVEEEHGEVARVDIHSTPIISDKPPSYDEALRTGRNGLPSYQEALRRESQISWIHLPGVCNPTGHNASSFHNR